MEKFRNVCKKIIGVINLTFLKLKYNWYWNRFKIIWDNNNIVEIKVREYDWIKFNN
jgi:hypothetical protein